MSSRLIVDQQKCLILQPCLIKKLGRTPSLFLQQLHYWLTSETDVGKIIDQKKWVYNSLEKWALQLCLSERQISRVISYLKSLGVIIVGHFNRKKCDRTKWYTIDYQTLENILSVSSQSEVNNTKHFNQDDPLLKRSMDKMSLSYRHNGDMYNKEPEITSENKTISTELVTVRGPEESFQQVNNVEKRDKLKNKKNLAFVLLEIWNQTIGEGNSSVQLTKKRAQYLVAAFKYRFNSSLEKWKQFCYQVTTSDFLMGKVKTTFKANLDWVLKFDIMQRILEGDFGIKSQEHLISYPHQEDLVDKIKAEIDSLEEIPDSKKLRHKILHDLGPNCYQSWFKDIVIEIDQQGRRLHLQAKNLFVKDFIESNYLDKIRSFSSNFIHISWGKRGGGSSDLLFNLRLY